MARHKWIARCKYRLIDIDFRGGIKIKLIIIFLVALCLKFAVKQKQWESEKEVRRIGS